MNNIKILVVDDEEKMRKLVKIYLNKEGYSVEEAVDGKDALDKFFSSQFSLVLLDVMMPNVDGWSVCKRIRESSSVPIIMFSARGEEYDKLFGFELGVDDYITKPFSPKEMVARVKAVLKRSLGNKRVNNELTLGHIKFLPMSRQVFTDNIEINLTPKEYELLYFMALNQNIVFSREQLLSKVWGTGYKFMDFSSSFLRQILY